MSHTESSGSLDALIEIRFMSLFPIVLAKESIVRHICSYIEYTLLAPELFLFVELIHVEFITTLFGFLLLLLLLLFGFLFSLLSVLLLRILLLCSRLFLDSVSGVNFLESIIDKLFVYRKRLSVHPKRH